MKRTPVLYIVTYQSPYTRKQRKISFHGRHRARGLAQAYNGTVKAIYVDRGEYDTCDVALPED